MLSCPRPSTRAIGRGSRRYSSNSAPTATARTADSRHAVLASSSRPRGWVAMMTIHAHSSGRLCTVSSAWGTSLAILVRNDDADSRIWAPRLLGSSWIGMPVGLGLVSAGAEAAGCGEPGGAPGCGGGDVAVSVVVLWPAPG